MANINELQTALSLGKQADISTSTLVGVMGQFLNLNRSEWAQNPITENDAVEIGKGHEFATALYKSHYAPPDYEFRKYLSAEWAAWVMAFSLGNVVKSGSTPNFTYTCTPALGATNATELELPYCSFLQQIRPGGSAVLDQLFTGIAVRSWRLSVTNSPGRASAMLSATLVHCGKYTEPSTYTMPAAVTLHEMQAGGMTLTINSINYVTAKSFISLEASWDNNFRMGFFPGSGSQDGFQTQGRLEFGDRACGFVYRARFANGSTELTKLKALTTGTAVLVMTYDSNNATTWTYQKLAFQTAVLGETDGIVTVEVTAVLMYHPTNGLLTVVAKAALDGICQ